MSGSPEEKGYKFTKPSLDSPRDVERMNQKERIQRLHHQLGVIYGRVFLTGDWRGDDWKQIPDTKLSEDIATNIFEDQKVVEASDLVDGLTDFLRDAGQTVPARLNHEDLMRTEGRNDFNRALFL